MSKDFACILCGSAAGPARLERPRFRDGAEARHGIATCGACGHVQLSPLMSLAEEAAYYGNDQQPKDIFGTDDYHAILRAKSLVETERRLKWLGSVLPAGARMLDVGSGYGFFVDACCAAGYAAEGLEVSGARLLLARKGKGLFHQRQADEAFVADFAGRYDAVTSFHCVEHLRDPVGYVRNLARLVKPGGHLLIEVPNLTDEMMEIPEYAIHQWQVCHYSYFDRRRLEKLMRKAGLTQFVVKGVQRYDLRHLLRWTDLGKPDLTAGGAQGTNALMERTEALYRKDREDRFTCDTLIATARLS